MSFNRFGASPNGGSARPSNESRRMPGAPPTGPPSSGAPSTTMTRAERFEDERRRITESCFSKIDTNGQLHESYITHIRVTEDATSPQLPPPPNGNPSNKKNRVVIISVRNSGRVRLHKGRENANGSFSIGKTWNMEDLSAIENWTHLAPKDKEEARRKEWAGDTGFTVTIAKPYYWEAGTAKEKEFFIASMIKIFHKYTQGKFPVLTGFDPDTKQALMNIQASPQAPQGQLPPAIPVQASFPPPSPRNIPPSSPDPTGMQRFPSRPSDDSRAASFETDRRPPPLRDERRPPPLEDRRPTPLGDDRRPPPLEERRPTPLGDDRRPPPLGEDRKPPAFGEGRRPPPLGDDRRPPPLGEDRRPPPLAGDVRRPPPLGAERRPPPLGDDRRPAPPFGEARRPPGSRGEGDVPPPRRPSEGERRAMGLRAQASHGQFRAGEDDRRPPPLRGQASHGQLPSQMPPYLQGPRPRPSMEQGMRSQPSRERMDMRSPPSREQMRPMPGQMQGSTPPIPSSLTPQSSRSQMSTQRPKTPESVTSVPSNLSPGRRARQDGDAGSMRSVEEMNLDGGYTAPPKDARRPNGFPRDPSPRGLRPGTAQSNASSAFSRHDDTEDRPQRTAPPERRRPPMLVASSQQTQRNIASDSNDQLHTPLASPLPPGLQAGRRPSEPDRRPSEPERRPSGPETQPSELEPWTDDNNKPAAEPKAAQPSESPAASPISPPPTSALPALPKPSEVKAQEPVVPTKPTEAPSAPSETTSPLEANDEERPDASSMPKKEPSKAADVLRKAAFAYGAFKPRAGGAAKKLFNKEVKNPDEPDGISGVVPAPSRAPVSAENEKKEGELERPASSSAKKQVDTDVPALTISSPKSAGPPVAELKETNQRSPSPSPERSAKAEPEGRKKKRRSNRQIENISKLGIDPSLLDGRGLEFESILSDLGWGTPGQQSKTVDDLEADIKREIARVEAGSWLSHLEQKDERVEAVENLLDQVIAQCDALDGYLTLYNVELSSLTEDVAYIEAQSQGLQVQTANQKLLQSELKQLVDTISITPVQLEPLRRAPIGKIPGLQAIESALVLLYKALITIDPMLAQSHAGSSTDLTKYSSSSNLGNTELASMQALQEKRELYLQEGAMFLARLVQFMDMTYGAALLDTKDALAKRDVGSKPFAQHNVDAHDVARNALWQYSPLLLFAKQVDRNSWETLIKMYQTRATGIYQSEIRDNVSTWRRLARRPTGDEQDLLFTAQEKESDSLTGAARKLTVKRSQTLARGLRVASGEKDKDKDKEKADRSQSGKHHPFEAFASTLDDLSPLLLTEQNFITDFFHATSSESIDFVDAVEAAPPENRFPTNLHVRRPFEPDRAMAKRVADIMDDIFSFLPNELSSLVEWAVKADPLQGVGILCAVDRKLLEVEDSNQDFLTRTLQKIHERLTGLFVRFVDEQIRAIEDTKVKIKKRKGIIAFMKTFPHFAVAIENMLPPSDEHGRLEIRSMVDDAYQKINKAMFESLNVIAKESPAVMASHGQGDPEDKEALNYHILLIENMNHYIEEVDHRADTVLGEWKSKAEQEFEQHMSLYVDAVIRRPLGKLLEFIESTEAILGQPGMSPQALSTRSSHSRSVFRKLAASHDGKEIRKGVEALKKRVDKHFGDADDPSLSRNLVAKVLKECEKSYLDVYERTARIGQDVYAGEVEWDWGRNEVSAAFRK